MFVVAVAMVGLLLPARTWACMPGPDAVSAEALDAAAEAQRAVREHLAQVRDDRKTRLFYRALREDERAIEVQPSLLYDFAGIADYGVCDGTAFRDATMERDRLGAGLAVGFRDVARLEARLFGVSDSLVQKNTAAYRPPEAEGAWATVPGAGGLGQGMWALRLELFDVAAMSVGRVRSQRITHEVGWEVEYDDEGERTGLTEAETDRWSPIRGPDAAQWFVAVGSPRWAMTDIVFGGDELRRIGLSSGWFGLGDSRLELRGAGAWDGIARQPVVETEVAWRVPRREHLRLAVLGATELGEPRLREGSARLSYGWSVGQLIAVDDERADIDLLHAEARTGVFGGERLADVAEAALAPGADLSVSVTIPLYVIVRIGGFVGINRPQTLEAVPHAAGRAEWGTSLYTTYVF